MRPFPSAFAQLFHYFSFSLSLLILTFIYFLFFSPTWIRDCIGDLRCSPRSLRIHHPRHLSRVLSSNYPIIFLLPSLSILAFIYFLFFYTYVIRDFLHWRDTRRRFRYPRCSPMSLRFHHLRHLYQVLSPNYSIVFILPFLSILTFISINFSFLHRRDARLYATFGYSRCSPRSLRFHHLERVARVDPSNYLISQHLVRGPCGCFDPAAHNSTQWAGTMPFYYTIPHGTGEMETRQLVWLFTRLIAATKPDY